MCGGKDRFRFDNKEGRGTYFCNVCGTGDGFDLATKVTGKSFADVAKIITDVTGEKSKMHVSTKEDDTDQRKAIKRVWEASHTPVPGGAVRRYLHNRLGIGWRCNSIRELKGNNHWLMVAKIIGADNTAQNVHLTYLTEDGRKADVTPNRRIMSGPLPDGSAIRLDTEHVRMSIAKGIETAMAASVLFNIPVWAAVNAQNLAKWVPPAVAKCVTVFGDNDVSYTGQAAAYTLARRLTLQHRLIVDVQFPPVAGQDWADVLAAASKDQGQL